MLEHVCTDGLGNDDGAVLDGPAEEDLARVLVKPGRNGLEQLVLDVVPVDLGRLSLLLLLAHGGIGHHLNALRMSPLVNRLPC